MFVLPGHFLIKNYKMFPTQNSVKESKFNIKKDKTQTRKWGRFVFWRQGPGR
jgi:hypothetical protein